MWKVEPRTVCWQPPCRPQVSVHPQLSHSPPSLSASHNHSPRHPTLCSFAHTHWFITACHLPMPKKQNRGKWNNVQFFPFPLNKCVCNLHVPDASSCALQRTTKYLESTSYDLTLNRNHGGSSRVVHQCCCGPHVTKMGGDWTELPTSRFPGGKPLQTDTRSWVHRKMFSTMWQRH